MTLAKISALRSKDPVTIVGACIVDKTKRVIGLGYNGMPKGNDVDFSWKKSEEDPLESKYSFVVHAEINAMLNTTAIIKEAILYTTLFPCSNCAKIIAQTDIKEIVFLTINQEKETENKIAEKIFSKSGITFRRLESEVSVNSLVGEFFKDQKC